jgi:hypothetical protein
MIAALATLLVFQLVGEALVAFVLANAFLEKFGGDSLAELRRNYDRTVAGDKERAAVAATEFYRQRRAEIGPWHRQCADEAAEVGQRRLAQHEAGARHGLVFPGPGRVAATVLLVVGVGVKGGDQQTRAAVGSQRGVDLEQVALGGLGGQPVDQLAHKGGIGLGGGLVGVFVDEDDVQVAAVAQLFATELAVTNDAELGHVAMARFQTLPDPLRGHAQHRVG